MTKTSPVSSASVPPAGVRVAVVAARWNEEITGALLAGALARLEAVGIAADRVDVHRVPGSFELPLAADRIAAAGRHAAVLCLGTIIRGETRHDRYIAAAVAQGIEQCARARGLPVLFGVLTCENEAQARERARVPVAGGAWDGLAFAANKGAECAAAAVEMMALLARIDAPDR